MPRKLSRDEVQKLSVEPAPPAVVPAASPWGSQGLLFFFAIALCGVGWWGLRVESVTSALLTVAMLVFVGTEIKKGWVGVDAVDSARWLELARKEADRPPPSGYAKAFELARRAWRAAPRGNRTEADSLALMGYLLVQDRRGNEGLSLLKAVPPGFVAPPKTVAEAQLLGGNSQAALDLLAPRLAAGGEPHEAHVYVRGLLQTGRFDEAIAWLHQRTAVCSDAWLELQQVLLQEGRCEQAISVGELGMTREPNPLGAWLLADACHAAGQPEPEARWRALATELGYEAQRLADLKLRLARYVFLTSGESGGTVLPLTIDLDGPDATSPGDLAVRWVGVALGAQALTCLIVHLPVAVASERSGGYPSLAVDVAGGLVLGGLLGLGQFAVLRRYLAGAALWIPLTVAGAVVGAVSTRYVVVSQPVVALREAADIVLLLPTLPLLGATLFQLFLLGRWFPRTWPWAVPALAAAVLVETGGWWLLPIIGRVGIDSGLTPWVALAVALVVLRVLAAALTSAPCAALVAVWMRQRQAGRVRL